MKNNWKIFSLLATILLITTLTSCEKDDVVPNPIDNTSEKPSGKIGDFFKSNTTESQEFTIDASIYNEIVGEQGTVISFWDNSFVDVDGNLVTGNIDIELKEIFSLKDMILNMKPTMSNGQLLVSGGEFYVRASQNGEEVFLNQTANFQVLTDNFDNNMEIFVGEYMEDSIGIDTLDWEPIDTVDVAFCTDSMQTDFSYCFDFGDLGWINLDYYNQDNPVTIDVVLNDSTSYSDSLYYSDSIFNYENLSVFFASSETNSVAYLPINGSIDLPIGLEGTIVAIAELEDVFYSYFVDIVVADELVVTISLSPTTEAAIQTELDGL